MDKKRRKFNTVPTKWEFHPSECKLLLSNISCGLHSVDLFYDDVMAKDAYRTVCCENVALFDTAVLNRLAYIGDAVRAAVAYSLRSDVCNIISNRACLPSTYAAAAISLYYHGRVREGGRIRVVCGLNELRATVRRGGVILFA